MCESAVNWQYSDRLLEITGKPTALSFSADGKLLAVATEDRVVQLFETASGVLVQSLPATTLPVGALALSPDGELLAAVGTAGVQPGQFELRVWRIADGTPVHELLDRENTSQGDSCPPLPFAAFSPDSSLLAIRGRDRTIGLWDVKRREIKLTWSSLGVPCSVAFSPDGTMLAEATHIGESHGSVAVYSVKTGARKRTLWNLYSGALLVVFAGDGGEVMAAFHHAFAKSEMDDDLASRGEDKFQWNWESSAPNRVAKAVAFSAGGRILAVVTEETRIDASGKLEWIGRPRLFVRDIESGQVFPPNEEVDGPVALSLDGKLLATGSTGHRTILWRIP